MYAKVTKALRDFDLDVAFTVPEGESATILGPNGCGKTTLLHCVAGLTRPDRGSIRLAGHTLFDSSSGICVEPRRRNVGLVFQEYALFPHMTVADNVAYGLRARGMHRHERDRRVRRSLEMLKVETLADDYPTRLSGGEQQRVALARAMAVQPDMLLLDEPLGALDVTMRQHLRRELRAVLRDLGTTSLVVTHSYDDAAELGRQVIVMDRGRVTHQGTHDDLVRHPRSQFVADLSGVNYLEGVVTAEETQPRRIDAGSISVHAITDMEGEVSVSFYPTDVMVALEEPRTSARNVLRGTLERSVVLGDRVRMQVHTPVPILTEVTRASYLEMGMHEGSTVYLFFKATALRVQPRNPAVQTPA